MNLIAYSDSEDSGGEGPAPPQPATKPASKPAFQKVIDRSQPGKIKLNLPGASQPRAEKDDIEADAPPAKKARIGGGTFSGFNAMLPAPKKPNANTAGEGSAGKKGLGKGLGAGVNLKTGAEPAFQRAARVEEEEYDVNGNPMKKEALQKADFRALLNLPPPKTEATADNTSDRVAEIAPPEAKAEVKPVARPKFMPMSVARGKQKKAAPRKAATALEGTATPPAAAPIPASAEPKPAAKPKVSLFSISQDADIPAKDKSNDDYQPLLYDAEEDVPPVPVDAFEDQSTYPSTQYTAPPAGGVPTTSNDLTNIAAELNLTEAERRQLFGRKGHGIDPTSAKIVEFNTDTEYTHNEVLRQQGETVQHNALRSITGTGKNSLRSLVNVATSQKDALEDHFAQGRRNKREAGNKYGW